MTDQAAIHALNKKVYEVACADIDDVQDVFASCEQACADWSDGTQSNFCIETVKQPGTSNPQWDPFQCTETGYVGTDGLPEPGAGDDDDDDDSADGESGGAAPPWEPGAYISYNQTLDVYIIDEELVDAVKAQPTLLALDGSYLEERTTNGFEFKGVTTGSLPDLLGLANGDVTRGINGHTLNTMQDAMGALAAVQDATSINFTVNRGGTIVSLDYLIR